MQANAQEGRWWALPLALTVVATGVLWDPQSASYGALKGALLALGTLATVITAGVRMHRGTGWDLRGPVLAVGGLAIWATVTLWWAPSRAAGLGDMKLALAAVILLLAGRVLLQGASARQVLVVALAATGWIASVVALVEAVLGRSTPAGTIGNPNHLAAYIAASGPALVWFGWSGFGQGTGRWGWRLVRWAAGLGPALFALWLTGCRSAWLALGAGIAVWVALQQPTRQRRTLALGGTLLLGLVAGAALAWSPSPWRQRLGGRLYLARISARLAVDGAPWGHGVGGFASRFPAAQARRLASHPEERPLWTHARTAHCEPLHALVELGAVGGLLVVLVSLYLLGAMVGGRGPPSAVRLVAASGLAILGVSSLAEGTLHTVALLTLAAALAALLWKPSAPRVGSGRASIPAVGLAVGLALVASTLVVSTTRHYAADRLVTRARLAQAPEQRLALLRQAVRVAPNPGRSRFYLGLALAQQGRPRAAARTLRRSAGDFPNLGTFVALGNTLMALGRYPEAAALYRHATWLHPRYAAAHHNLGLAQRRLGRHRASQASLRRARRIWPGRWLEPWRIRAIRSLIRPAKGPS